MSRLQFCDCSGSQQTNENIVFILKYRVRLSRTKYESVHVVPTICVEIET